MRREKTGGINAVEALLARSPDRVIQLWFHPGSERAAALAGEARTGGIPVQESNPRALDRMVSGETHQGIVAEFQPVEPGTEADLDELAERHGSDFLVLLLDQVQDPHNLGACMRSAAAAGACAVVAPRDRAASLTPAARRAAAGAAESLPLIEVANLARTMDRLRKLGVWCVGLAGEAEQTLWSVDLSGPLALVLGGEERGLRRLTRERCDLLAAVPMPGNAESLNVSVAAGIALFEAVRQRSAR